MQQIKGVRSKFQVIFLEHEQQTERYRKKGEVV